MTGYQKCEYLRNCSRQAEKVALLDTLEGKKNTPVCADHEDNAAGLGCFEKWMDSPSELADYSQEGEPR